MNWSANRESRVRLGLVLTSAALITSACAAGKESQTTNETSTLDGNNADVGKIALRAIAIHRPNAAFYKAGEDVQLIGVISNNGIGTDRLVGISTKAAGGWAEFADAGKATDAAITAGEGKKSVAIAGGQRISFGVPESKGAVVLTDLTGTLYPAQSVQVTFTFAKAGSVTMAVPVQISAERNNPTIPPAEGGNE